MNARLLGFIVVFVAVLVATGTLLQAPDTEVARVEQQDERVDAEMHQLRTTEWDGEGDPSYQLTAAAMQHYPDRAVVTLDAVEMHFNSAAGTPWLVRAPAATTQDDGSRIELHGEVLMQRDPTKGNVETWRMETADITIFPDQQRAESAAPITITHGPNRTTAIGMTADFAAEGRLQLHSDIRSTYVQSN